MIWSPTYHAVTFTQLATQDYSEAGYSERKNPEDPLLERSNSADADAAVGDGR